MNTDNFKVKNLSQLFLGKDFNTRQELALFLVEENYLFYKFLEEDLKNDDEIISKFLSIYKYSKKK